MMKKEMLLERMLDRELRPLIVRRVCLTAYEPDRVQYKGTLADYKMHTVRMKGDDGSHRLFSLDTIESIDDLTIYVGRFVEPRHERSSDAYRIPGMYCHFEDRNEYLREHFYQLSRR